MKRALAGVAAVVMIVVSLVVRAHLNDDDGGGSGGGGALRLRCATELAEVCDAFRSAVDADVTVTTGSPDAWLTFDGVDEETPATNRRTVVASTRLGVFVWQDSLATLPCKAQLTWRCMGDAVPRGFKPGHPPPDTAVGRLVLGQLTASYFGRSDVSTADLEDDDTFGSWFQAVERALPNPIDLNGFFTQGRAAADAWATTEAEATTELRNVARAGVTVQYPQPMTTARVVVASRTGDARGDRLQSLLRGEAATKALRDKGFQAPAAAGTSGLPSPGLLQVLAEMSREATR